MRLKIHWWESPELVVIQDLFMGKLTESTTFLLPGTSAFEKEGTFVNHAGLAQTFARSVRPPVEVRTELQVAHVPDALSARTDARLILLAGTSRSYRAANNRYRAFSSANDRSGIAATAIRRGPSEAKRRGGRPCLSPSASHLLFC